MNAESWLLIAGACAVAVNAGFVLGRRWGFRNGLRSGLRETERRFRGREAYWEGRLREYAGLLESVVRESERRAARDSADWWKHGGRPPGER